METEFPFGSPRKRPSFFEPISKELEKKIRKTKNNFFLVLKEKKRGFIKGSEEQARWIIKIGLFIKRIMKELVKVNPILLFGLRKVYKLSENQNGKNSIIKNQIIHDASSRIKSMDWTNYSLTEKKMKDLSDRTSTIRNQIEKIT